MMREDWVEIELGKALVIERGGSPRPIKDYITDSDDGINWIKIGDTKINSKYITGTAQKIKRDGLKKTRYVKKGDLLLSNSMSFGRPYILATDGAIHDGWLVLKNATDFKIDSEYLYYALSSPTIFAQFDKLATGSTVRNLNTDLVSRVIAPIAPFSIQRAIVSKIEALFSDLDNGIADLKKVQEQLKIYRQAVLKKAFEGEWELTKLENVSEAVGGYAFKSKSFADNGKYQIIRIGNVRPGLLRYETAPVYINEIDEKIENRYKLQKSDVVISLTGTRKKRDYGFTAIIDQENLLLNQRLAYIRFSNEYLSKFFLYYSWSEPFKIQFFGSETGNTGQGNVGMKSVKETLVPFPTINEQHQIVREIESRLSVCDKVEQNIAEALEKSEALRQSILKKAFEGKLLSEAEIAKCKEEADYEPASELLKKTKADNK